MYTSYYLSPIGLIEICENERGLLSLHFVDIESVVKSDSQPCCEQSMFQLEEYFQGRRKEFTLDLVIKGTEFENKVWRELMKIPYGQTRSYKDIARSIGNPNAVRAVGNANRTNKIPIIIPCHRVIGHDGKLVGFGGGLWRKEWLLQHEKAYLSR